MPLQLQGLKQPTQSPQEAMKACKETTKDQHERMLLPLQNIIQPTQSPQEVENKAARPHTACHKTQREQKVEMLLPLPVTTQPTQSPQKHTACTACTKPPKEEQKRMLLPLENTVQPTQSPQEHDNNKAEPHTARNKTQRGQQVGMLLPLPVTTQPTQSPQKHNAYTACKTKPEEKQKGRLMPLPVTKQPTQSPRKTRPTTSDEEIAQRVSDNSKSECGSPHGPLGRIVGGSANNDEDHTAEKGLHNNRTNLNSTKKGNEDRFKEPRASNEKRPEGPQAPATARTGKPQNRKPTQPVWQQTSSTRPAEEHAENAQTQTTTTGMLLSLPITMQPTQSPQNHTAYKAWKTKPKEQQKGMLLPLPATKQPTQSPQEARPTTSDEKIAPMTSDNSKSECGSPHGPLGRIVGGGANNERIAEAPS
jgi:hypothetical protein